MNYTITAIMAAISCVASPTIRALAADECPSTPSQSYFTHRSARAMRRPLLVYIPAGILIAYSQSLAVLSAHPY